jgi:hypothetical protein
LDLDEQTSVGRGGHGARFWGIGHQAIEPLLSAGKVLSQCRALT